MGVLPSGRRQDRRIRDFRSQRAETKARDTKWTEAGPILIITSIFPNIFFVVPALYYFALLGFIMSVIGALLIVLGRKVFGLRHSTYASMSLGIIVAVNFLLVIGAFNFPFSIVPVNASLGISEVFLTFGLQDLRGRVLPWAGYASILASAVTLISKPLANPSDFLNPVIELLTFVRAATFTLAFLLAFSRIRKGVLQLMPGQ